MAGLAARGWGVRDDEEDAPTLPDSTAPKQTPKVEIRDFIGLSKPVPSQPVEVSPSANEVLQIELVNLRNHVLDLIAERGKLQEEHDSFAKKVEHLERENETLREKAVQLTAQISREKLRFTIILAVLAAGAATCVKLMLENEWVSSWRE
mmetsp:Transcript_17598/g.35954  ORF Transcript_17598/g.35954 Transcript_17598/m.35954 type:complete len:150 (-) Transcript_17598:74-523(-)